MAEGLTYFGSGKPVRNIDGALAMGVAGNGLLGLGMFDQVGDYIYEDDLDTEATLTPLAGAVAVVLHTSDQTVYVTLNNTAATSTNGLPLAPADGARLFPLQGGNPVRIVEAAASAIVRGMWVKPTTQ